MAHSIESGVCVIKTLLLRPAWPEILRNVGASWGGGGGVVGSRSSSLSVT